MPSRRRIAVAATIATIALAPAAAVAQSGAGDEQYGDPFGDSSQPAKPKPKPQPAQTPTPTPTQAAPDPNPGASKPESATTTQPQELPRTGRNLLGLTVAGVVLVAAGALLLLRRTSARRG